MGSVSYLNKKFVVLLAFSMLSVDRTYCREAITVYRPTGYREAIHDDNKIVARSTRS